jgi:hypothetical protein
VRPVTRWWLTQWLGRAHGTRPTRRERHVELCDAIPQLTDPDIVVAADVRRREHHLDPVIRRLARHRNRVRLIEGPVVDGREDVAMQVNEAHQRRFTNRGRGSREPRSSVDGVCMRCEPRPPREG